MKSVIIKIPLAGECVQHSDSPGALSTSIKGQQHMNNITKTASSGNSPFDSIRRTDENGQEYWLARQLQEMLGYKRWDKFLDCIEQAIENIGFSGQDTTDHVSLMEGLGTLDGLANPKPSVDYKLSRFGCYHLVLACPGKGKPKVALAKQYFVAKTRQAEVITADSFNSLHSTQLMGIRNALIDPGGVTPAQMGVLTEGVSPAVVAKIGALTNEQYIKLYLERRTSRVPQDIQDQKDAGLFNEAELKIADKTIERFDRLQKLASQNWQHTIASVTNQNALANALG